MSTTINAIQTTTNPNGTGWVNQANGNVLTRHRTKVNAVDSGRLQAKRHGAQHTIHRKDGTVISSRSYAVSPIA